MYVVGGRTWSVNQYLLGEGNDINQFFGGEWGVQTKDVKGKNRACKSMYVVWLGRERGVHIDVVCLWGGERGAQIDIVRENKQNNKILIHEITLTEIHKQNMQTKNNTHTHTNNAQTKPWDKTCKKTKHTNRTPQKKHPKTEQHLNNILSHSLSHHRSPSTTPTHSNNMQTCAQTGHKHTHQPANEPIKFKF